MMKDDIEAFRLCIEVIRYIDAEPHASVRNFAKMRAMKHIATASPDTELVKKLTDAERSVIRRAITKVQEEFNVTLLTEQDTQLPANARDKTLTFIRRLEQFVLAFETLAGGYRETVRISAIDAAITYWIPVALRELLIHSQDGPHVVCNTREWWDVIEDVRLGHADFGFGTAMPCDSLKQVVVLDRPHIAVFSKALKKLVGKDVIDVPDFEEHGVVCLHSFATPLGIDARLLNQQVRMIRVTNCAQAIAWVEQGLGIALLTSDLIPAKSGLVTRPVAFSAIAARDSLYCRKVRKKGSKKGGKDESELAPTSERDVMVPAAKAAYDAILAYWQAKSL